MQAERRIRARKEVEQVAENQVIGNNRSTEEVYRVLIVDDHPHGREGMRGIVESEPCFAVVGEAASGEEAIEAVRRLAPDMVLMDVNMPGMGGLEAAQHVKREHPDIKIVIVTAYDEPAFLFEALRCGAQGFLPKNVRPSVWIDYLRSVANDETPMSSEVARMLLKTFAGGGVDGQGADAVEAAGPAGAADMEGLAGSGAGMDSGDAADGEAGPGGKPSAGRLPGGRMPRSLSWLSSKVSASTRRQSSGGKTEAPTASTGGRRSGGRRSAGVLTPLTQREREVLERVASGESNREIAAKLGLSEHTVKNHLKNILQKLHLDNRVQLTRYAYESGIVGRDGDGEG